MKLVISICGRENCVIEFINKLFMIYYYYYYYFPDAPSINRVLPVVTPNNLYISSRGRVVFGLLTVDKYTKDMEEYLSDEFRQFIAGKQVKFTESDIEKVSQMVK